MNLRLWQFISRLVCRLWLTSRLLMHPQNKLRGLTRVASMGFLRLSPGVDTDAEHFRVGATLTCAAKEKGTRDLSRMP